jgi:catechol 2,3-dioxygenase-like lactoylglutathione lyase family enzyme
MTPDLPTGRHNPLDRSPHPAGVVLPRGFAHVRLTVTDIHRSKEFYRRLLGREPGTDFSDQIDEPGVRQDPQRVYGGCSFTFEGQTLGLRPVAAPPSRRCRSGPHHRKPLPAPDRVARLPRNCCRHTGIPGEPAPTSRRPRGTSQDRGRRDIR